MRRLGTHRAKNRHRSLLEPARQEINRYAHDQHEQTDTPIQQKNSDRRNHHGQQSNRQLANATVQEATDRINIAGQTRNDLARGVTFMERHTQRLRVTEHPLTQVHHHTQRHAHRVRHVNPRENRGHRGSRHKKHQQGQQDRCVTLLERLNGTIQDAGNQNRRNRRRPRNQKHRNNRQRQRPTMRAQHLTQQSHRAFTGFRALLRGHLLPRLRRTMMGH